MRNQAIVQTYTAAQTDVVLVAASPKTRIHLTGCIITAHADNTQKPRVCVKLGTQIVIEHPGVPAGGGLAVSGLDISTAQGDSLAVSGDDPGGSYAVTLQYRTS